MHLISMKPLSFLLLFCVRAGDLSFLFKDNQEANVNLNLMNNFNSNFEDVEFPGHSHSHSISRRDLEDLQFKSVQNEMQLIPENYDVLQRPPTNDGSATKVNFSVILFTVRGIDEKEEKMTVEINLRMFWRDLRLNHFANSTANSSFLVLNPNLLKSIWHPDVYIDHAISISQPAVITPPASLRIYPDSTIRYSARLTVTMACRMDFHFYPVDTQKCRIELKSFAYHRGLVELAWIAGKKSAYTASALDLPNFDVDLDQTRNYTTTTSSGVYTNLELVISLRRKISYHLIQTYLPSSIFLVVSWLSFLIPKESVPERIGSCMMTLLTLTVMFGAVGQTMPKVSYLTALDIWMVTCIVFVFLALIEFTVVLKLWSLESDARRKEAEDPFYYQNQRKQNNKTIKSLESKRECFEMKEPNSCKKYKVSSNNYNNLNPAFSPDNPQGQSQIQSHNNGQGQVQGHGECEETQSEARPRTMTVSSEVDLEWKNGREESTKEGHDYESIDHMTSREVHDLYKRKVVSERGERYVRIAKGLEKVTSITLPCLFVVFNWIYWPWLTFASDPDHQQ